MTRRLTCSCATATEGIAHPLWSPRKSEVIWGGTNLPGVGDGSIAAINNTNVRWL